MLWAKRAVKSKEKDKKLKDFIFLSACEEFESHCMLVHQS